MYGLGVFVCIQHFVFDWKLFILKIYSRNHLVSYFICILVFSPKSMEKIKNELDAQPIMAPAIVADKSDTIVPANIALKPSSTSMGFILGAITPIPPI